LYLEEVLLEFSITLDSGGFPWNFDSLMLVDFVAEFLRDNFVKLR
jgi:hypothetical protein